MSEELCDPPAGHYVFWQKQAHCESLRREKKKKKGKMSPNVRMRIMQNSWGIISQRGGRAPRYRAEPGALWMDGRTAVILTVRTLRPDTGKLEQCCLVPAGINATC